MSCGGYSSWAFDLIAGQCCLSCIVNLLGFYLLPDQPGITESLLGEHQLQTMLLSVEEGKLRPHEGNFLKSPSLSVSKMWPGKSRVLPAAGSTACESFTSEKLIQSYTFRPNKGTLHTEMFECSAGNCQTAEVN